MNVSRRSVLASIAALPIVGGAAKLFGYAPAPLAPQLIVPPAEWYGKLPAPWLATTVIQPAPLVGDVGDELGSVDPIKVREADGVRGALLARAKRRPGQHLPSVHIFPNGLRGNGGVYDFEMLTSVVLQRGQEFVMVPFKDAIPAKSIASLAAKSKGTLVTVELNGETLFQVEMAGKIPGPLKGKALEQHMASYSAKCDICDKPMPEGAHDVKRHKEVAHRDEMQLRAMADRVATVIKERGLL